MEQFSRTENLIGKTGVEKLNRARVVVFGVGGVGGYVIEALARSGVGAVDIVDNDVVSQSNINRQIIALHSTVGKKKTQVMQERLLDINPSIKVQTHDLFFLPDTPFDFTPYDYVIDAIDTVSGKIAVIEGAKKAFATITFQLLLGITPFQSLMQRQKQATKSIRAVLTLTGFTEWFP